MISSLQDLYLCWSSKTRFEVKDAAGILSGDRSSQN